MASASPGTFQLRIVDSTYASSPWKGSARCDAATPGSRASAAATIAAVARTLALICSLPNGRSTSRSPALVERGIVDPLHVGQREAPLIAVLATTAREGNAGCRHERQVVATHVAK